jgi:hypothetical protein
VVAGIKPINLSRIEDMDDNQRSLMPPSVASPSATPVILRGMNFRGS